MSDPSNPMQQPSSPDPYGGPSGAPGPAHGRGPAAISVADLIAGIGGAVTFIFSFLSFFEPAGGGDGFNAWDTDTSAFASTIPAILGLALAVVIGLRLGKVQLPERVITFSADQILATWGISAAGIMISFIATDILGQSDKGIGFWFMLIGSLAMAAGTIMKLVGAGANAINLGGGGTTQAGQPGVGQQGGYQTPPGYQSPPPAGGQQPGAPPPPPPAV